MAYRFSLAALVLLPFALRYGWLTDLGAFRRGGQAGLWLFVGFALQTWGLALDAPPAHAAFLTSLSVVFVPLLLRLVYRRTAERSALFGAALALVGLLLLTRVWSEGLRAGDLLVAGCAVAFAMHVLAVDRQVAAVGPGRLLFVQVVVCALLGWLAVAVSGERPQVGGATGWQAIAATAVLATVGGFGAQTWAQQHTPPTRTAVIFAMEPVFATWVALAWTAERFGPLAAAGAAAILTGVLTAELGRRW